MFTITTNVYWKIIMKLHIKIDHDIMGHQITNANIAMLYSSMQKQVLQLNIKLFDIIIVVNGARH